MVTTVTNLVVEGGSHLRPWLSSSAAVTAVAVVVTREIWNLLTTAKKKEAPASSDVVTTSSDPDPKIVALETKVEAMKGEVSEARQEALDLRDRVSKLEAIQKLEVKP